MVFRGLRGVCVMKGPYASISFGKVTVLEGCGCPSESVITLVFVSSSLRNSVGLPIVVPGRLSKVNVSILMSFSVPSSGCSSRPFPCPLSTMMGAGASLCN